MKEIAEKKTVTIDPRQHQILERAMMLFKQHGIRRVSLADISTGLGMSKKTFYKYYSNKEELIHKTLDHMIQSYQKKRERGLKEIKSLDAILVLFKLSQRIKRIIGRQEDAFFYDLERYYPEELEYFATRMHHYGVEGMRMNIEKGCLEGLYRPNLNAHLTGSLYTESIVNFFKNPRGNMLNYSEQEIFKSLFEGFVRSIATEKGIVLLEKHIEENRKKLLEV